MSKSKNRRQRQGPPEQNRSADQNRSTSEKTQEQVRNSSMERTRAQGSPADVASKHQRRFGHN